MKIVKIIAVVTVLFMTSLIIICCIAKHPLDSQYEQTLQMIIEEGQFPSETAALQATPELIEIKNQIIHIKALKAEISDFGRGKPTPQNTNDQLELVEKVDIINKTQKIVIQKLYSLRKSA